MKKLVIALVAAAMAGLANAAYVDWKATGLSSYNGKAFYVFDASDKDTVLSALGAVDGTTAGTLTSLALKAGKVGKGVASAGSTNLGSATSVMGLVLGGDIADGTGYLWIVDDVSESIYTPPASSPGYFTSTLATTGTSGTMKAKEDPEPTPEPTSGLLLVLGVAGLALRRKAK